MDLNMIIKSLENKTSVSDDEKEIIEIVQELKKVPFDRTSAEEKMSKIYRKYFDIKLKVGLLSNTEMKDSNLLSDKDIYDNLCAQLYFLYEKLLQKKK